MAISGTDWLEVPTIYKAYFLGLFFWEYPHKIWSYMVHYLHFRILKFQLRRWMVLGCFGAAMEVSSWGNHRTKWCLFFLFWLNQLKRWMCSIYLLSDCKIFLWSDPSSVLLRCQRLRWNDVTSMYQRMYSILWHRFRSNIQLRPI